MMTEAVLVALISGGVTLLGTIITVIVSSNKQRTNMETKLAVIDEKIATLKASVDKHNNFGSRIPVLEEQVKVINHRLEDLEHDK